jgi:hypothetical protein
MPDEFEEATKVLQAADILSNDPVVLEEGNSRSCLVIKPLTSRHGAYLNRTLDDLAASAIQLSHTKGFK